MTTTAPETTDILFDNRQAFHRFNRFKLTRTFQTLPPGERWIFYLIPRLLHINQEGFPGYVAGDAPCGINNFILTKESQVACEFMFPDLISSRPKNLKPIIQTALLMGSVGSIAMTKKSDLDYTLLVDKNSVSPERMELFKKKLLLIEKWAWKTFLIEVHFFINDIEEVKKNIFGESDSESTGSALAKLLKEEMYRTAIIVAGKIPLWLIVPVETDDEQYAAYLHQLQSGQSILNSNEFVDMGNVDDISQGEFFGGSIWALIKSFQSPFKTLMKMGLLEEYMFGDTKSNLLCHQVKNLIFSDKEYLAIDPYLMLFDRVEKYFKETKSENEVDALRTAFYLKVGTQIAPEELDEKPDTHTKQTLVRMIREWEWSAKKLEQLNDYKNWQIMQKVSLGNRVNKILMNSYKKISEKNKTLAPGESLISKRDTHLLGRKLFSYYRTAPNKVESLFALVDGKSSEKELTFLFDNEKPREGGNWFLIRGKTLAFLEHVPKENIIQNSTGLPFLIAFAGFNRLYNKNTTILLRAERQSIKDADLHLMLQKISKFLTKINIAAISNEELLAESEVRQIYLIVDFGYPLPRDITIGNINDCKSLDEYNEFLRRRLSAALNVTPIYMTSWGELFCKTFSGANCISRFVNELGPKVNLDIQDENLLKIFIPSGRKETLEVPWLHDYIEMSLKSKAKGQTQKLAS